MITTTTVLPTTVSYGKQYFEKITQTTRIAEALIVKRIEVVENLGRFLVTTQTKLEEYTKHSTIDRLANRDEVDAILDSFIDYYYQIAAFLDKHTADHLKEYLQQAQNPCVEQTKTVRDDLAERIIDRTRILLYPIGLRALIFAGRWTTRRKQRLCDKIQDCRRFWKEQLHDRVVRWYKWWKVVGRDWPGPYRWDK